MDVICRRWESQIAFSVSADDIYYAVVSCDEPLSSCQSVARESVAKCRMYFERRKVSSHDNSSITTRNMSSFESTLCAAFSLCATKYRSKRYTRFTGPITNRIFRQMFNSSQPARNFEESAFSSTFGRYPWWQSAGSSSSCNAFNQASDI